MQVYNLSQNVQEDDLQHLQVRPLSLLLCITEVAVLLSALASCVALQRHFRIHSHKIFFSFPALILVHGQGGTVTWFETCLAYALTVWLLGAWVLWQGSQWDICQEGLFLSLGHVFLEADHLWSWKGSTAVLCAAAGGWRAWRG